MSEMLQILQTIALLCQVHTGASATRYDWVATKNATCQAYFLHCMAEEEKSIEVCTLERWKELKK